MSDTDLQWSKESFANGAGPGDSKVFRMTDLKHPILLPEEPGEGRQTLEATRLTNAPKDACTSQQMSAQEMFLASILQAQLCVLDLQDELDKQPQNTETAEHLSSHPVETTALVSIPEGVIISESSEGEDGHFTPDSSDEDLEDRLWSARDGEDDFSESDEEYHFYNNPLFGGSLSPSVTISTPEVGRGLKVEKACSSKDEEEIDSGLPEVGQDVRSGCLGYGGVNLLGHTIEQRTEVVRSHFALSNGLIAEGLHNSSVLVSASHNNDVASSSLKTTFSSPTEDAQETSSSKPLPQQSEASCSSTVVHTFSGETGATQRESNLDEGLLISDSSFSMIAALLLDVDFAQSNLPLNTRDSCNSVAESGLSVHSLGPQVNTAESYLPVDSTDPEVSAVESCLLVRTQDPLRNNTDCHPQVHTENPPVIADDSNLSTVSVKSPPVTPDLISWEEPIRHPVIFYTGRPATPVHLLDWSMDRRSHSYSSSDEEEVDGFVKVQRPSKAFTEDAKVTDSETDDAEESFYTNCPSPSGSYSSIRSQETEFESIDGLSLSNGALKDHDAAKTLATKLYNLDGFRKSEVAPHLQKNTDFSRMVAQEYLAFFDFTGKTLDQALRSLLKVLVLTGETQERERVLQQFSHRYYVCNPEVFSSADAVHTLTCAVMLLNTDLHGKNIGRCMSCPEFIINLDGMNDGTNFPKDQLKELYHSIRNEKLEWAVDEEEARRALVPKLETSYSFSRKRSNPFHDVQLPDPKAETYKQGVLSRKMHADIDGKRTPWGKRGWKDFYTILKGTMLCLLKEEYRLDYQYSEEVISIHHALAERASKYNKRPNVFRLQTADWRIYLFQAESDAEMNSWVSRINLVAAMNSAPPFPAAIGSQKKFVRPILPTAHSKQSLEDQRQSHELWMDTFTDDLAEHQRNLPDKKSKARDWEEYRTRGEYLLYEKIRYETYVKLLDAKLRSGTNDLDQWEAQLQESSDTVDDSSSLKKSHSSPSLTQEQSPTVKVKRNISERRTYRRIIPKRNKNPM
ncbi:hypothetical protein NDU88_004896 [Pleurodeles waltl]|uniref:Uncharacterized protein n=3 Tax=Pleurodeles waltl TaxID=8319 RepID=A0AAV7LK13_PLEWA|nr:hypothetical protein NDU88_004896 [Pleurodeles waltl]